MCVIHSEAPYASGTCAAYMCTCPETHRDEADSGGTVCKFDYLGDYVQANLTGLVPDRKQAVCSAGIDPWSPAGRADRSSGMLTQLTATIDKCATAAAMSRSMMPKHCLFVMFLLRVPHLLAESVQECAPCAQDSGPVSTKP
jgi:hypothetical protein